MKLHQLRYLCEIADRGYRFSGAAESLGLSQPGLSRQIKLLERELGVDLFVRNRGRIADVTPPGRDVIAVSRSALREIERVSAVAREFAEGLGGQLSIAATYVLARYALPGVYRRFAALYPRVSLKLVQGTPDRVAEMAASGEVDIAVTNRHGDPSPRTVLIDYGELPRVLMVPAGHPLLRRKPVTLQAVSEFPLIRVGRHKMRDLFAEHGIRPREIFTDLEADIDVVKAMVESGLGVAVLPAIAYDARRDSKLRAIPVGHIFEPLVCSLAVRGNHLLRNYMYDFIRLLAPGLDRSKVDAALSRSS